MRHNEIDGLEASEPTRAGDDIIGRILKVETSLSKAHRKIAEAILREPQAFAARPIEELVPWLGISAPTITRFARLLGCDGLRDLKLKIMGSMRVGLRYFEPLDQHPEQPEDIALRVAMRAQNAIVAAQRSIDLAMLERAIDVAIGCRILYAFGGGGVSSWLVEEVQNRLFRLGIHVIPNADHQMQMMLAATMNEQDLLLCCSLTGNNQELVRAARIAAGYGARTLAFTAPRTPLAAAVQMPLTIELTDDGDVLGPTSMRYGFLAAIDMLAYGCAVRRRPAAQEQLRRIKQQFITYRDEDDSQPVCD
ncbi:transcriptional regulator, RpiR family [Arboricoccus pini]|uniref:Transcriptional regulator, RpiR family n=1 Tax=Arboricoccus pini TaxID=1963835 RepID=A0A212RY26_9PROT|nr:MurR/RpiR family transcriptional regulator [Arboricoccus pini]SNB77688.1 transcriptional regulator, RpiR family [Arboricoccus pini]